MRYPSLLLIERLTFDEALAAACPERATHRWPALVNPAQHGDPIPGRTPAIFEPPHDLPAPLVGRDELGRRIVVTHENNFQLATTSFARSARDAGNRFRHV